VKGRTDEGVKQPVTSRARLLAVLACGYIIFTTYKLYVCMHLHCNVLLQCSYGSNRNNTNLVAMLRYDTTELEEF